MADAPAGPESGTPQPQETQATPQVSDAERQIGGRNVPGQGDGVIEAEALFEELMQPTPGVWDGPKQETPEAAVEPEAQPEPAQSAEPAPDTPPAYHERYKDEDAKNQALDEKQAQIDRLGTEAGKMRAEFAALQAEKAVRAELAAQKAQPKQPDVRQQLFDDSYRDLKEIHGMSDEQARIAAQNETARTMTAAGTLISQAEERYAPTMNQIRANDALQQRVNSVAGEVNQTGQPVRPDWEDVSKTPAFQAELQADPTLIQSAAGLKYAYVQAKLAALEKGAQVVTDAEGMKAEARGMLDQEKAAAAAVHGQAPAPEAERTPDEKAMDEMFAVGEKRHILQGGSAY